MEQVKQSSLLDDAAFQFSKDNWNNQIERECSIHTVNQEAFKAGAQWQKEQDKELIRKINGLQAWITDGQMRTLFTSVVNQILHG